MTAAPLPKLFDRDTILYAAAPAPRQDEWLGWDRFTFTQPRLEEMTLSIAYNPTFETWVRVTPSQSPLAHAWAEAARKAGYYVAYPVADDPDPEQRTVQHKAFAAALRFFYRRRHPNSAMAKRHALIKQFPDIHRPPKPAFESWPSTQHLPDFPNTLPDMGTPTKVTRPWLRPWKSKKGLTSDAPSGIVELRPPDRRNGAGTEPEGTPASTRVLNG